MSAPLADRMRPERLDDIAGQRHLFANGAPLRRIIESGVVPNLIFYGPPGTGKTTSARIIAKTAGKRLHTLNGTSATTGDIKDVISEINTIAAPGGLILYLDEIQYFNKKQQQSLLQYTENGDITLIASTTENPYFYIYPALLSRSTVFEFKPVSENDAKTAIARGFERIAEDSGEKYVFGGDIVEYIARASGGDMRRAMNFTELCALAAEPASNGERLIGIETVQNICANNAARFDRQGDEYYDLLSAFQKSMRGSDANAAVHYLARILEAGDIASAARRLLVCANEDVGLAYPMIIPIVKAAVDTAFQVGLPEARIPLANAVILVCNSPKSNSAYLAVNAAAADIQHGMSGEIPRCLQNKHFDGADAAVPGQFYKYPHDYPNHWVAQQYLPDKIKNREYYVFGENKNEQAAREYQNRIKNKK